MRFKIEIVTRNNGTKQYAPYVRERQFLIPYWSPLSFQVKINYSVNIYVSSKEEALKIIEEHYQGSVKSIEIEYINKP